MPLGPLPVLGIVHCLEHSTLNNVITICFTFLYPNNYK